ncbi:MAG: four helix bundle protein [Lentisphaerae bacterium]|nr:four helix bundle protein [Lentisphaerota bacterium]
MRDYRNNVAWQKSHEVTLRVYGATKSFPADERFGLTSQMRRAAYSVPSNIVEGCARESKKDYLRFLYIAMASAKEMEYFLLLAHDLGYLPDTEYEALNGLAYRAIGTLDGLIKAVRKQVGLLANVSALLVSATLVALGRLYYHA